MKSDLDIDLLRAFVAVADTLSFTHAAQRLDRVQSAVSMQVQRLEDIVGKRLFARHRRMVALTYEGEVLLGYARRILQLNEEALEKLGQASLEGVVRLGATDMSTCFLPDVLSHFAQAYPRVQLEVHCDRSWHLLDAIDANELDLALVTQECGRLGGKIVRQEPLVWVAARGHLVHEADPLPLAVFAPGCAYREAALRALDASDRKWRIAYSSPSQAALKAAVWAGLAVTVMAQSTVRKDFRVLGSDEGLPSLPLFEIRLYQARDELTAPVAKLADTIVKSLGIQFLPERHSY